MATTTIRLPENLKSRIARAAARSNRSAHSYILEAIADKADQDERRGDFEDVAEQRYASIVATGKTIAWPDMRRYLEERLAAKAAKRPRARKLG